MFISDFYKIVFLFLLYIICLIILPQKLETFEQLKIKINQNPININLNLNNNFDKNNPEIIVPIYAPWSRYYNFNSIYPFYNNYF
jgi:hypothetical protein